MWLVRNRIKAQGLKAWGQQNLEEKTKWVRLLVSILVLPIHVLLF